MTDLDVTVVAIIARDGPLSAYDVRKVFDASLTPTWSSSTGSVYPSIKRLLAEGLVIASASEGPRGRSELTPTPKARVLLGEWVSSVDAAGAAATPDPVRTRMFFLGLLPPEQRRAAVANAIAATQAAIHQAELRRARRPQAANDLERLSTEGVFLELRARLEWLNRLGDLVGSASE